MIVLVKNCYLVIFFIDVPKEIRNPEIYLPIAEATICETGTLVAATRIRSDHIFVPPNYTFCKQYGENAKLKITFPPGVTNELLSLKVQVIYIKVQLS